MSEENLKNPVCTVPGLECQARCLCFEQEIDGDIGPAIGWFAEDARDDQFNVCLCCGYPFFPVDGSEAADNHIRIEYCEKCAYSRCDVSTDEFRSGHCPRRLGRRAAK